MDKSMKREQETNKERKIEPHTAATSTIAPSQPLDNLSPNDDDSITTSTESSDTFETWTLVMDKQKNEMVDRVEILRSSEGEDEEDEEEEEEEEDDKDDNTHETDHKQLQDSLHDDLSDGISIISESESNGRISPHPYLRDHLQDLNLKFATAQHVDDEILYNLRDATAVEPPFPTPVIVPPEQQVRQRPGRSPPSGQQEDKDKAIQMASQTVAELSNIPPMVKRGLQGIFYIGVALAILSLIGRMRNPTWGGTTSPSSAELEQKVNDLELQNNLMRAEIDLLNKQVKYLSTMNEPQQQYQKKTGKYKGHYEQENSKEAKKFKAWPGNGDSLRPVEITKGDLKRPYKCPDGTFREVAGMCVENKRNEPNIVEQFEQVVEEFKQHSETMQTFEKVAQELHGFTESPFEQVQQILSQSGNQEEPDVKMRQSLDKQTNDFVKNKPIYKAEDSQQHQFDYKQQEQRMPSSPPTKEGEEYQHQQGPSPSAHDRRKDYAKSKERYEQGQAFDKRSFDKDYKKSHDKENHHPKAFDNQSKERKHKHRDDDDGNDASKDRFNKRKNDSKERYQKRDDNTKERYQKRDDDNDSKERYQKRRDDDNSKEHYGKRSKENSSKERFNRQKPPNESGEWQEEYMKHRADIRKQNEEKYSGENKNWYMKRGDGRENKRNGDIRYR